MTSLLHYAVLCVGAWVVVAGIVYFAARYLPDDDPVAPDDGEVH